MKIMKKIKFTTILAIMLGTFIFSSCARKYKIKYECKRSEGIAFVFNFQDTLYQTKYPLKAIKIEIKEIGVNKDSIIKPIIKFSHSGQNQHTYLLTNCVNFNTVITFNIANKQFIFNEFEIQKGRTETMFGGYYESCDIIGCKVNGVKMGSDWHANIKTGL